MLTQLGAKQKFWLLVLVLTGMLMVLSWFMMKDDAFFAPDTGLRFLQIKALIANEGKLFAMPRPAEFVDPELRHLPYYSAYLIVDDAIYVSITPYFPLLTAWFYKSLGAIGLSLIPVLAGVATAIMVYYLVCLAELPRPVIPFLATIFASPILFYMVTLWDHTLGTAFALSGLLAVATGMVRSQIKWVVLGGLLLALAAGQRPEGHVFALAVALALPLSYGWRWRSLWALLLGGIVGTLPIWLSQHWWFKHPLAPKVAHVMFKYGQPVQSISAQTAQQSPLPHWLEVFLFFLFIPFPGPPVILIVTVALILLLVGAILLFVSLPFTRWRRHSMLVIGFVVLLGAYILFAWAANDAILGGLVPAFPLLILALLLGAPPLNRSIAQQRVDKLVMYSAVAFLSLMFLFWPAYGGLQWGARYLLPVYPLFVYLAWRNYTLYHAALPANLKRVFQMGSVGLLLVGGLLQVMGVYRLYNLQQSYVYLKDALAVESAEIVLVDKEHLPSQLAGTDKIFITVSNQADTDLMLDRLTQAGVSEVLLLGTTVDTLSPIDLAHDIEVVRLR